MKNKTKWVLSLLATMSVVYASAPERLHDLTEDNLTIPLATRDSMGLYDALGKLEANIRSFKHKPSIDLFKSYQSELESLSGHIWANGIEAPIIRIKGLIRLLTEQDSSEDARLAAELQEADRRGDPGAAPGPVDAFKEEANLLEGSYRVKEQQIRAELQGKLRMACERAEQRKAEMLFRMQQELDQELSGLKDAYNVRLGGLKRELVSSLTSTATDIFGPEVADSVLRSYFGPRETDVSSPTFGGTGGAAYFPD